jgi:hypothetical protein
VEWDVTPVRVEGTRLLVGSELTLAAWLRRGAGRTAQSLVYVAAWVVACGLGDLIVRALGIR